MSGRLVVGFGALGCALLVLASPAAALPKLPSPITIPTLPSLPAVPTPPSVPTLPGIGGLPIVQQPVDVPLPVSVPLPDFPLPLDLPLPLDAAALSTFAVPDLGGLPVSVDQLAAAVSTDGEQPAADGESSGTPAAGSQPTSTSGLLRQPGTDSSPFGTRCFLTTSASIASADECLTARRQSALAATTRPDSSTARVEVGGISLARTGGAILGLVALAGLLLVVGASVLRFRRRTGAGASAG